MSYGLASIFINKEIEIGEVLDWLYKQRITKGEKCITCLLHGWRSKRELAVVGLRVTMAFYGWERKVTSPAWSQEVLLGRYWEDGAGRKMDAQNIEEDPEEEEQSVTGSAVVQEETKELEMLGWVGTETRRW